MFNINRCVRIFQSSTSTYFKFDLLNINKLHETKKKRFILHINSISISCTDSLYLRKKYFRKCFNAGEIPAASDPLKPPQCSSLGQDSRVSKQNTQKNRAEYAHFLWPLLSTTKSLDTIRGQKIHYGVFLRTFCYLPCSFPSNYRKHILM